MVIIIDNTLKAIEKMPDRDGNRLIEFFNKKYPEKVFKKTKSGIGYLKCFSLKK